MRERLFVSKTLQPSSQTDSSHHLTTDMKKTYHGLKTKIITVVTEQMMTGSPQKIKAKTQNQDWRTENVDLEMGMSDMTISDISSGGSRLHHDWDSN